MNMIENDLTEIIDADEYEVPGEVSETEAIIYDWVYDNFGESEAVDPSWNIHALAEYIDEVKESLASKNIKYSKKHTIKYRL